MVLVFWLVGVGIAMYKIWFPSLEIIKIIYPENILTARPILSTIVVFCIFFLALPFMVIPLLIPNRLEEFVLGFVRGAEKIK